MFTATYYGGSILFLDTTEEKKGSCGIYFIGVVHEVVEWTPLQWFRNSKSCLLAGS